MQLNLLDLPSIDSPLRYIGSKKKLWPLVRSHIPSNVDTIISPFIGGASLELRSTASGFNIIGTDIFEPLTSFWQQFILDPNKVTTNAKDRFPLAKEEILSYQELGIPKELDDLNRAVIYWLVNLQSYSGQALSTKSFGVSYTTKNTFNKYLTWQNNNVNIYQSDCFDTIEKYEGQFMYLDPPYIDKEHFYGQNNTERIFDHERLCNVLNQINNQWILSYGYHEHIEEMYSNYTILRPCYTSSLTNKTGKQTSVTELSILNV